MSIDSRMSTGPSKKRKKTAATVAANDGCEKTQNPEKDGVEATVGGAKSREAVKTVTSNSNRAAWANKFFAKKINMLQLFKEFTALKVPSKCPTLAMDKNYDKCRYADIPCNDATRVILQNRPPENDFIHANWMVMPDGFKYISTQGPMDETLEDFWHMVVTEKVANILMVCDFVEGDDVIKCAQYIPKENKDSREYGGYTVKRVGKVENPMEDVKQQVFEVSHKDSPEKIATVNHYHYTNWPDHTAPKTSGSVLKLYNLFRNSGNTQPVVVHCSAGIGRTATFIGIDYGSQRITQSADVQMLDLIREMRKMRDKAVQTHHQFVFMIVCICDLFVSEGLPKSEFMEAFHESYIVRWNHNMKRNEKKKKKK